MPTLMHDEPAYLAQYVDKRMPVLIIGGKYHQKQVVLTSNPKEKEFISCKDKSYPGVTNQQKRFNIFIRLLYAKRVALLWSNSF